MQHGWQHLRPEDRDAILRGVADGKVYGGPYHIELDWVDKCNARCFFCNSEGLQNGKSIPWERAEELILEACEMGLRSIRLSGGGEPTLHPHLPDLLRILGERGVVLDNLTTNGTRLTDAVIEGLMRVPIHEVRVSLNYCDEQNYAEGMGLPAKFFERVVDGMRRLDHARQGNPRFGRFMTQFFVVRKTAGQIREMYRLGRELGADVITFRELSLVEPDVYYTEQQAPEILEAMCEVIREDWREGRVECHLSSHGVGEAVWKIYEELEAELGGPLPPLAARQHRFDESNRYCVIGWYSMTILGNQTVFPCCFLMPHPYLPPIESVAERGIRAVWHGPEYGRFRREMREFMLNREPAAFFNRRMKKVAHSCHKHAECPLSAHLADPGFYEEADRRLEVARRQPINIGRRLLNRAARRLEGRLDGGQGF